MAARGGLDGARGRGHRCRPIHIHIHIHVDVDVDVDVDVHVHVHVHVHVSVHVHGRGRDEASAHKLGPLVTSANHCGAGCTLGDVIDEFAVFALVYWLLDVLVVLSAGRGSAGEAADARDHDVAGDGGEEPCEGPSWTAPRKAWRA